MPLTNKFLRYSPEITLEIFTLVWDKFEQSGYDLSTGINTIFKNWKTWVYIIIEDNNICTTDRRISNLLETTVQEILGYDPFVKNDFVLPEKWCIKRNNSRINAWLNKNNSSEFSYKTLNNDYAHIPGIKGYHLFGHIQNGYIEITFEQFQKYVLKESIETPKEGIPEYVELLEGFDSTRTGKIFDTKNVIPLMNDWSSSWTWESIFKNDLQKVYFKPSTKKDFDAQNKPKSIEKWSPETYVVCIKEYGDHFKFGDVAQIQDGAYKIHENCVDISKSVKYPCMPFKDWCKWFATKHEAEEFSKTLVESVKHGNGFLDAVDIKQPLKQAVHCKTQEEWNFVTKKLGYKWDDAKWEHYGDNSKIDLNKKEYGQTFYNYQILSFQEWCDLNGYKMESNIDLTGRYLKALVDGPQSTTYKKDDIVEIFKKESSNQYRIGKVGGAWWTYTTNNGTESQWELLPEDYKMEKEVKFEVGKWYRVTDGKCKAIGNYRWYAKSPTLINNIIKTEEYLYENSICKCGNFGKIGTYTFTEVSIEEIQQYLPDSHPDKIKVDREFKIGDFVISLDKSRNYIVDEFCIISKLSKNHLACKNKPQDGWAMKPFRNFRHATPEEITNHYKDDIFRYKQTMYGALWIGGTIGNHLDAMIPTKTQSEIEFNYLPEPK